MAKFLTVYDRVYKHLFDDKEETKLSEKDYEVKRRVQAVFTKKLDHPSITDKSLVNFLMKEFGVQKSAAYMDITAVETIFGNFRKANKEYVRMLVTEELKEVITVEKIRLSKDLEADRKKVETERTGGNYKTDGLVAAISALARANNLDKDDPNLPNWEEVQPPVIEPTDDITVMDLDPVPDESVNVLRQKYLGKMKNIREAEEV